MQEQPLTTAENTEHIHLVQSIIESSEELRRRIIRYLKNLNVEMTHLELLRDLFRYYNPYLLDQLNKTEYLITKLHDREKRSYDFYTLWFECFLCDEHYAQTEDESQQFQQLINEWSKQFQYDRELLEKISMKLNILVEKLTVVLKPKTHDRRLDYFINSIVNICFKQSKNCFFWIHKCKI